MANTSKAVIMVFLVISTRQFSTAESPQQVVQIFNKSVQRANVDNSPIYEYEDKIANINTAPETISQLQIKFGSNNETSYSQHSLYTKPEKVKTFFYQVLVMLQSMYSNALFGAVMFDNYVPTATTIEVEVKNANGTIINKSMPGILSTFMYFIDGRALVVYAVAPVYDENSYKMVEFVKCEGNSCILFAEVTLIDKYDKCY